MGEASRERRRGLVETASKALSIRKQCELLGVNRSGLYYKEKPPNIEEADLLNMIRDVWLRRSFYGYRRITKELKSQGVKVNKKRVQCVMQKSGIHALYPGPNTSKPNKEHAVYPYLLRGLVINKADQVWMTDITYLRTKKGCMYLIALIDVHSRYVVGWCLSNTMEATGCKDALKQALLLERLPGIINSDQGSQYTSDDWISFLKEKNIKISMTGKGRCLDNIYIERFWRSFKYEEFYLNEYDSVIALKKAINSYINFYNHERWHQALYYKRPADVYFDDAGEKKTVDMCTSPSDQPIPYGACGQAWITLLR